MATCNTCRSEYDWGENPCWRCGEDNSYWEEQRRLPRHKRFWGFFGNAWGIVALVMVIFPLIQLAVILIYNIFWAGYPGASLSDQKGSILAQGLAWFLSFIAVTFVYAMRFQLWNYSWIRNIRWKKSPPIDVMAVLLFMAGVVLLLGYLTILMFYVPAPRETAVGFDFAGFFQKIIVPTLYSLIFLCFATASMLMATVLYTARLNENVGQPIYMNTNLLTEVVKKAVVDTLKTSILLRVANLERTGRGGIRLILNQISSMPGPDAANPDLTPGPSIMSESNATESRADGGQVEGRYEVESTEWGQIQILRERPLGGK
jgi:hypothetical protein